MELEKNTRMMEKKETLEAVLIRQLLGVCACVFLFT